MSEVISGSIVFLMVICLGGMWIGVGITMVRSGDDLTRREFEMKKLLAAQSGDKAKEADHE